MTAETKNQIKKFTSSRDMSLVPQILIGMQEEDNVAGVLRYRSCLKQLRNIAAHEPATFTSQVKAGNNVNSFKIVFTMQKGIKLSVDMTQFTAWMFDAYIKLDNIAYLSFWKAFMLSLYPAWEKSCEYTYSFKYGEKTLVKYLKWADIAAEYGMPKAINPDDDYIDKLYGENQKLFWRFAIADMSCFVRCYVNGTFDLKDKANILTYLEFFEARESGVLWEQNS